jgi:hypothetical protein
MNLEAEIECTQRCTWWLGLLEFGDAQGGHDRFSVDMHLEAKIEDPEMHSEAVIQRVWRLIWRPRCSEPRDALRDDDRATLEKSLEPVDLVGSAMVAETQFIG